MILVIFPERIDGKILYEQLNRSYLCPTCKGPRTSKKEHDSEWVVCPLMKHTIKYICEGCCNDINSSSRDIEDFKKREDKGAYNWVKSDLDDTAKTVGMSPDEVQLVCLNHQLEIIAGNPNRYETSEGLVIKNNILDNIKKLTKKS